MAAAKPIMSDSVLRTIFSAMIKAEVMPDKEMMACLMKATKKSEYELQLLYTDCYQQINQVDTDPFVPPAPIIG